MARRTLYLAVIVAAMVTGATAQQAHEVCPVRIKKIDTSNGFKAGMAAQVAGAQISRGYFLIDYVNQSDKQVATVRFGVGYLNSMRELAYVETVTTKEQKVKPGKTFSVVGANGYITAGQKMQSVGWVEKIMFTDGTYWNDDGSRFCGNFVVPEQRPSETASTMSGTAIDDQSIKK